MINPQTPRQNLAVTKYLENYTPPAKPNFLALPQNPLDLILNILLWIYFCALSGSFLRWGVDLALTTYKPLEVILAGGVISFLAGVTFWFIWVKFADHQNLILFRLILIAVSVAIGSY